MASALSFTVRLDEAVEGRAAHVGDALHAYVPVALDGPSDDDLAAPVAAALAPGLAADVGLVNFDDAEQRRAFERVIAIASRMRCERCHAVRRATPSVRWSWSGRDALLALAHEVDRNEPLAEGQVGVVQYRVAVTLNC